MKVLLDTCVLSEIKKKLPNQQVLEFIEDLPSKDIFLSAITIGEIEKGIRLLKDSDRKASLEKWLLSLEKRYSHRILPIDLEVARLWGQLTAQSLSQGKTLSVSDGLIAATAMSNGLRVVTRNVSDFDFTSVILINPWDV